MLNRRSFFSRIVGAPLVAKALTAIKPKAIEPEPLARVDGANQEGPTLIVNDVSGLNEGDLVTIEGFWQCNPITRQPIVGRKRVFLVASRHPGERSLVVAPPIIPRGMYTNCSGTPKHGARIDPYLPKSGKEIGYWEKL